jgi:hypothetical protein
MGCSPPETPPFAEEGTSSGKFRILAGQKRPGGKFSDFRKIFPAKTPDFCQKNPRFLPDFFQDFSRILAPFGF